MAFHRRTDDDPTLNAGLIGSLDPRGGGGGGYSDIYTHT